MKPLYRWVGGKTRLLPTIHRIIGDRPIRHYFETFFGGGAVFFSLGDRAKKSYLNDANITLIEALNQLRDRPELVFSHIRLMREEGADYYALREELNRGPIGLARKAALFFALNHMGYNGLWRVSKAGHLNTPQGTTSGGKPRTLSSPPFPFELMAERALMLKHAVINAVPFERLAESEHSSLNKECGEGDFVFFDPPYLDVFAEYTAAAFGELHHTLLANQARVCASKGALVIVCGSDSKKSRDIYGEPKEMVKLKRTVGASNRGDVRECIWVYGE